MSRLQFGFELLRDALFCLFHTAGLGRLGRYSFRHRCYRIGNLNQQNSYVIGAIVLTIDVDWEIIVKNKCVSRCKI